jgi:hypothetical protein
MTITSPAPVSIRPLRGQNAFRPAISKHALVLPQAPVADLPVASPPIPMPVPVQQPSPSAQATNQWAPIPCHTILPEKRFRLR